MIKIDDRVIAIYTDVMKKEVKLRASSHPLGKILDSNFEAEKMYFLAWRIMEKAKSSFVSRSYNKIYGLFSDSFIYESVGAHTNLASAIVEAALDAIYGIEFGNSSLSNFRTADGYSYREIMETINLHDLPENVTGDLPDNSTRDETKKYISEYTYMKEYLDTLPASMAKNGAKILKLFSEMESRVSPTGKLVYLADKIAALVITLALDSLGHSPMIGMDDPCASERDKKEMQICMRCHAGKYRASEMWSIDFFVIRKLVDYDDSYFFTALIVMCTLMVNDRWYSWREVQYLEPIN